MFMKSGVRNAGQFEVVGKRESGHLLLECADCTRRFDYDPMSGVENWHTVGMGGDLADFIAREVLAEKQNEKQSTM